MGRVHKKKIAEYAEEAENAKRESAEVENEKNKPTTLKNIDSTGDYSDDEPDKSERGANSSDEDAESKAKSDASKTSKTNRRKIVSAEKPGKKSQKTDAENGGDLDKDGDSDSGVSPPKKGRKAAQKGKTPVRGNNRVRKEVEKILDDEESENDDGEPEYEVKEIINHKTMSGAVHYLVRWKGYTKDDDTWEPEESLSCPDLIEKYNKNKKVAKITTKPTKDGPKRSVNARSKEGKSGDPEKEWEVEKIIDYADDKNGGRIFRIRWKGFNSKHDTWEPEENLSCDDVVEKFLQRMKSQENITFKELREEPKKTKRLVNETAPRTNYSSKIGRKSKRSNKQRVYYGDSDA